MHIQFSSVALLCPTLQPHGLQHARLPCPSPTPGACSHSCPSNWWSHPTISSSVIPLFWLQSFPASGSFPMSQLFASNGQSIGASASTSVLPKNIQGWFPFGIDLFDLLTVQGTLKSLLQHHSLKAWILWHSAFFMHIRVWKVLTLAQSFGSLLATLPAVEQGWPGYNFEEVHLPRSLLWCCQIIYVWISVPPLTVAFGWKTAFPILITFL